MNIIKKVAILVVASAFALVGSTVLTSSAAINRTPRGALDSVTVARTTIGVRGWALDQDTLKSIQVHVYVDGHYTKPLTANTYRPDIQRAYGIGNYHGYAASWLYPAGIHKVCTYAINVPAGTNPLLGCQTVTVPPMTPYPVTPPVTPPVVPVTKVLTFVEENHSRSQMTSQMPYTLSLAQRYGYATNYFATTHPSLPNYVAIAGGQTYGITNDNPPSANPVAGTSVFGQAIASGKTAAVYAEGMPQNCATVDNLATNYAVKHNPWAYFVNERTNCQKYDVPITQLDAAVTGGSLPNVGMVVPNLCNDAHNCSLGTADTWFKGWMTKIFNGPDWKSGHLAVVLTADEDDLSAGNNVLTVVIHPSQNAHVVTSPLTHYSLTRFYEDVAGTAHLFNAATAPSMTTAFGLPLTVLPQPTPTPTPTVTPTPTPTATVTGTGTVISNAFTTAYGWPDNTPPGAAISNPVIHSVAGGTGTYADPITIAVGHSLATGKDVLDYPAGTRFYIPNVRRYFIVEDTCGDGSAPQNGPCHNVSTAPAGTSVWVDMWAGGNGSNNAAVLTCEDAITGNHTIIKNPDAGRPVVVGPLYNGSCTAQFGG